jgi:hypothetical protein
LYTAPVTTGRSMSPSMKVTTTSWPRRGMKALPQLAPATGWSTRTQVPEASEAGEFEVARNGGVREPPGPWLMRFDCS